MINCIIIEDEPLAQELLKQYVLDHPDLHLTGLFVNPVEAMSIVESSQIDLLLLDINLPKISGINYYKSLIRKPLVVFTTAYPEYAVDGFELEAVDYLVKPFPFERFMKAITKVKDKLNKHPNQSEEVLVIKADKKLFRIPYTQLCYIESLRDFVKIHTEDGSILCSDTLRSLNQSLPENKFLRIHKSYIINLDKVDFMEGNQLSINNKKIPIGQAYRPGIVKKFNK